MSNRNFDASQITKRLGNKAVAKSIINNFSLPNTNPQTSNVNVSVINQVELGNSLFVTRGPTCTVLDNGCPCNSAVQQVMITDNPPTPPVEVGWATFLDGTAGDIARSVTTDSNGNIYVIGEYRSFANPIFVQNVLVNSQTPSFITLPATGAGKNIYLIKYNPNGQALWATFLNDINEVGYNVKVDGSDNVIIVGQYTSTAPIFVQNANGNTAPPFQNQTLITLPVASNFISGFIIKYNPSGQALWATGINGSYDDDIQSVAIDQNTDDIYVIGKFTVDSIISSIQLLNANGNSGPTYQQLSPVTLPLPPPPSFGISSLILVKYNSSGIVQWATYIEATSSFGQQGRSIIVSPDNFIYITGDYTSSVPITLKDANGNTGAPFQLVNPSNITLPSTGGSQATFLVKYNPSGKVQWATLATGTGNDQGNALAVFTNNDICLVGEYVNNLTIFDVLGNTQTTSAITVGTTTTSSSFIIRYNNSGIAQWATIIDGTGTDRALGVAIDSSNNIYVTGSYNNSAVTLKNANPPGQISSIVTLPLPTFGAAFLVKYNGSGIVQWATYLNGTFFDQGTSVAVDNSGNIFMTGEYRTATPIFVQNPTGNTAAPFQIPSLVTLPSTTLTAMFLIKYEP